MSVCLPPSALGGPSGNPQAALSGLEQGLLRPCLLNMGMRMYRPPSPYCMQVLFFAFLHAMAGGSLHIRAFPDS